MNLKLTAVLFLTGAAFPQARPDALNVIFPDGTALEIRTQSTGPNAPLSTRGSETVSPGAGFHRLVFGDSGKLLLGYDIEARRSALGSFQVSIKPIDNSAKAIPTLPAVREVPPLRAGDAVEVDILYQPATGERIYDVLKVLGSRPVPAPAQPREKFSLEGPSVKINGRTIQEPQNFWMRCGGVRVNIPGHGNYFLALAPSTQFPFQAAGWVDHNVLRFHAGNDLVELVVKSNALQRSEFGTVWVHSLPDSNPKPSSSVALSCGDHVDDLIKMATGRFSIRTGP